MVQWTQVCDNLQNSVSWSARMQSFESINQLTLPPQVDCRLRELLLRQSEGKLSESERHELDLLIEAKETLALVRAKATTLLNSAPATPIRLGQAVRNGLPVVLVPAGTPPIDPDAVRRFLQEEAILISHHRVTLGEGVCI
jgi:hypothetical protein